MNTISSLERRYATKAFDPTRTLSDDQLFQLTESLRLAPSSFGLQPWKFIVVANSDIRTKLVERARWQKQVSEASYLMVLCARDTITKLDVQKYIDNIAHVRWVELETLQWFKDSMEDFITNKTNEELRIWSEKQVYIAQWILLSTAAQLQIDACPMEWFDNIWYDKLLWLEWSWYHSVVIVPVWYRSKDDKYAQAHKVRYSAEQVIEYIK